VRLNSQRDLKPNWGIPYTRQHIDRLVAEGKFPRPFKLTPNGKNFWTDEQLEQLVRSRQSAAA